jgi:hypothetical protein
MSAFPIVVSVHDDASGYFEDLEVPALPVLNAVEALGRGVRRVHMDVELFRAFERFLEASSFEALRVADWIAKERLLSVSVIYARPIYQTARR